MTAYRLYFFSPRTHGIIRFEDLEAASDEAAIAAVQAYRGDRALELWRGTIKVHAVEATDLASRLIAMRASAARDEVSIRLPPAAQSA